MKNFFFGVIVGVGLTVLLLLLLPQSMTFLNRGKSIAFQLGWVKEGDSQDVSKIGQHTARFLQSFREQKQENIITKKAISTSDFEILSLRGEWEYGRLRVIGEIRNNGNIAAGVEVEAIARDSNGILIASSKFWPNSISNIPPGSTTGIGYTITEDRRASKVELRIVQTEVW